MFARTSDKRVDRFAQVFLLLMIAGLSCGTSRGQFRPQEGVEVRSEKQTAVPDRGAAELTFLGDSGSWISRHHFAVLLFPVVGKGTEATNFSRASNSTGRPMSFLSAGFVRMWQEAGAFGLNASVTTNVDPSSTWKGGVGNWSNSAMWTGGVPTATTDASIDGGKAIASPGNLDIVGAQVHNLTIDSNDSLTFLNGASLTVNGTSISNAGHIFLNSSGATTQMIRAEH